MRFWDSSAIIPLLVGEASSQAILAEYERDTDMLVWWATLPECVSALCRLERDGNLAGADLIVAINRLMAISVAWQEIQPTAAVRQMAIRLLRVHPLRAADALQLAAAIVGAENEPPSLGVVSLDDRLIGAAEREGFQAPNPLAEAPARPDQPFRHASKRRPL